MPICPDSIAIILNLVTAADARGLRREEKQDKTSSAFSLSHMAGCDDMKLESEKTPISIRRFQADNIDHVLEIEKQAFPKSAYAKEVLLTYARMLPDTFMVAELGHEIAGYIIFETSGHVLSMAVKPAFRKKGLGTALLMHAREGAEGRLWLEVRSKNVSAIAFYRKAGMEITARVPRYYGDDDALIMAAGQRFETISPDL
jgi:ribosomal-protein-alanine N-acetyltransferase